MEENMQIRLKFSIFKLTKMEKTFCLIYNSQDYILYFNNFDVGSSNSSNHLSKINGIKFIPNSIYS